MRVFLGITGASGLVYAERLIECMLAAGARVELCVSKAAHQVAALEMGEPWPARPEALQAFFLDRFPGHPGRLEVFGREDWLAPAASGSNPPDAAVICPCTTGSLAAIAQGLADSLIERAADVALKERRTLILVPREAPFSAIHLEHMLRLAKLGAVILPPNPGFYHRPQSIQDLVDFVVARILDHLRLPHDLMARWGE
ncbi:flavin prenyltransferase UbiX [Thiofaba sp. EF100]|uniref:flavin prenyltransferase UbiX n=1 Tax=Thiofaba sp. EF100 TaxID=3121274 RepID=UPI0032213E25